MNEFCPISQLNGPSKCWSCNKQCTFTSAVNQALDGLISDIPADWRDGLSLSDSLQMTLIDVLICSECYARTAVVFEFGSCQLGFAVAGTILDVEKKLTESTLHRLKDTLLEIGALPVVIWRVISSFLASDAKTFISSTPAVTHLSSEKSGGLFIGLDAKDTGMLISNNLKQFDLECFGCLCMYGKFSDFTLTSQDERAIRLDGPDSHRSRNVARGFCDRCGQSAHLYYLCQKRASFGLMIDFE